jgi:hypothetical protein
LIAGDAFAHVDNETYKDGKPSNAPPAKHYNSFFGHLFDSLGLFGGADPDSPVAHAKAYEEMAIAFYDITADVTGKPAVDKGKFDTAVKQVASTEGQVTKKNWYGKTVEDAEPTAILQRKILNEAIDYPIDPVTGKPSVIVVPENEYGFLGIPKLIEKVKNIFVAKEENK